MRDRATLRWAVGLVLLAGLVIAALTVRSPATTDRADALAQRLRCPVCQSESVADSPSPTALTMRTQIEEFVADGRSDAWIVDHYVGRYGRWIVLDPPLRADTLALWVLPIAVIVVGAGLVLRFRVRSAARPLSDGDRAVLEDELAQWTSERGTSERGTSERGRPQEARTE